MEIEADEGRRIRLELFGENYYIGVFKTGDGFYFIPTVPRENDPMMSRALRFGPPVSPGVVVELLSANGSHPYRKAGLQISQLFHNSSSPG